MTKCEMTNNDLQNTLQKRFSNINPTKQLETRRVTLVKKSV